MKKRFRKGISLILAAVLVLAMIPAVGATEVGTQNEPTYEYVFTIAAMGKTMTEEKNGYSFDTAATAAKESVTSVSSGTWIPIKRISGSSYRFLEKGIRFSVKDIDTADAHLLGSNGLMFKIKVAESATYIPSVSYYTHYNGSKVNVYISDEPIGTTAVTTYMRGVMNGTKEAVFSDSVNTYNGSLESTSEFDGDYKTDVFEGKKLNLEKDGEYYFIIAIDGAESSNASTAKGEVTASYSHEFYSHLYSFGLTKVETPEPEEDEGISGNVSFVATSNVGTQDMMTVTGTDYDKFIDEIPAGTYVTVTAPEKAGYEFKHWVRGSRDNGVYVSDESTYSFTALTNTFLTAIYENVSNEEDDAAVVEFYNGNGQYLDKATSIIGGTVDVPTAAPTLTGFVFANQWKSEDGIFTSETLLTRKLTRAVAQFNALDTTFDVTDHNGAVHKLTYGTEKTFTSADAVCWLRDDKVVDYGTSYTYAAWDDTVITTSPMGEIKPLVVLDSDAKNGARMIEYDDGRKNLIEVGIIFGTDADITIDSCSSKATSQENTAHGQFTAKPNRSESVARGYLIYEEDGAYKVVYSN